MWKCGPSGTDQESYSRVSPNVAQQDRLRKSRKRSVDVETGQSSRNKDAARQSGRGWHLDAHGVICASQPWPGSSVKTQPRTSATVTHCPNNVQHQHTMARQPVSRVTHATSSICTRCSVTCFSSLILRASIQFHCTRTCQSPQSGVRFQQATEASGRRFPNQSM